MIIVNTIGVLIYFASCAYIIKQDKRLFVFFASMTFHQVWSLISCYYNDLGIYNLELFRYTETTLATFRLSMLYFVFNLGILSMMLIIGKRPLAQVDYRWSKQPLDLGIVKIAFYGLAGFFILYIAATFYTGGIPVMSGFDKLSHSKEAGPVENILIVYGFLLAFILGYFRKMKGALSTNGILLGVFLIYQVLTGNKFSSLLLILTFYYAPIFARYFHKNPSVKVLKFKYLIIAVVVIAFFIGIAFGSYLYGSDDVSFAGYYLVNRILAFQGEMWWAIDYDYHKFGMYEPDHWNTEVEAILSPGDVASTDVGMKYLMIRVLGPDVAYPIIERGYLYTMTYPGILIAMVPLWAAFIIQFFVGVAFFIILYYIYYCIIYSHIIRSIISLTVLFPMMVVLATGNLSVFFTLGMAVKISILLALELIGSRNISGKERQNAIKGMR